MAYHTIKGETLKGNVLFGERTFGDIQISVSGAEAIVNLYGGSQTHDLSIWINDCQDGGALHAYNKEGAVDEQGHKFIFSTQGRDKISDIFHSGNNDPKTESLNIISPLGATLTGLSEVIRPYEYKDTVIQIKDEDIPFMGYSYAWEARLYTRVHSFVISKLQKVKLGSNLTLELSNTNFDSRVLGTSRVLPDLKNVKTGKSYAITGNGYTLPLPANVGDSDDYQINSFSKATNGPLTPGDLEDHRRYTAVTTDLFDDKITIYRAHNLSAPAVIRNGKVLSWGSVSHGKSYTIYRDGVAVATQTSTTYTIPDSDYYGCSYDWSVKANDSFILAGVYAEYDGDFVGGIKGPKICGHVMLTVYVYKESSKTTIKNVGSLYPPVVNITRNALNSYTLTVSTNPKNKISTTEKYKIVEGLSDSGTVSNSTISLNNLLPNTKYSYEIWSEGDGITSSIVSGSFTTVKASMPSVSTPVRTEFNAYQFVFTSIKYSIGSGIVDNAGSGVDYFDVYRNGIIYKSNAASPIIIDGLKCNTANTIKIVSVFRNDNSYNTEYEYVLDASKTPRLQTPTIRRENVYETNVEVQFGSTSEISTEPIVTSINLKWNAVEFASGYLLRDEYREFDNDLQTYIEGVRYYPTQEEGLPTEYLTSTTYNIPMNNVKGYHLYTIKAIATDKVYDNLDKTTNYYIDEEYSSVEQTGDETTRTDQIRADMNFPLNAPEAEWDPNTTTVTFKPVPNADFYSIQLVPMYGTTNILFRSFRLDEGQESLTYNFYDMVKDLKETEHFVATIIARSYNAFYFHPSADSTHALDSEDQKNPEKIPLPGNVYVYKLATPINLDLFTEGEGDQRLSWKWRPNPTENYEGMLGIAQNTAPYGYEVGIKPIDDEWVIKRPDGLGEDKYPELEHNFEEEYQSFLFPKMGQSLFTFQVKSIRDNTKTNHQPVFLDSDYIISSKGTLAAPQNFQRFVNRFTWSDAGDNVTSYVLWDYYTPDPEYLNELREQGIKEEDLPYTGLRTIVTVDGGLFVELGMEDGSLHRAEPGRHIYQIQGIATIRGIKYSSSIYMEEPLYGNLSLEEIETLYQESLISKDEYDSLILYKKHTIYCDIKYLKQLTPYYPNGYESIVEWDVLDEDVQYETTVNGLSEKDMQLDNQYVINDNPDNLYEPGVYYFSVRARSTVDEFLNQRSLWSETLPYNVIRLSRPEVSKVISTDDKGSRIYTFSWDDVPNATSYKLYHTYVPNEDLLDDSGNIIKEKDTAYEEVIPVQGSKAEIYLGAFPGAHTIFITAVSLNSELAIPTNYPNPRYMESENSEIFNFGVLKTPLIQIDGNTLYWEPIRGADYYTVYNYRTFYAQTDDTRFNISLNDPYSFSLTVVAESTDIDPDSGLPNTAPSDFSNSIEFTISRLPAPEKVKIIGNTLTWNTVVNASAYNIYANESLIAIPTTNSYDLTDFFNSNAGLITFYVTSASDGEIRTIINENTGKLEWMYYLESEESNSVIKSITKEKRYNIVIEGVNYDDIQLPFTVHYTLDETLDDAQLTLAYINRKEPFERLTPASLIIYEAGQGSDSYDMLIEADTVEDVQIGTEIKYKHSLTLIENTLKIQNEPVPDFTISRSKIKNILKIDTKEKVSKWNGNNIIPSSDFSTNYEPVSKIHWDYIGSHAKKQIDIFGVGETIFGDVYREYYSGENMLLPTVPYRLTSMIFNSREKEKTIWQEIGHFFGSIGMIVGGAFVLAAGIATTAFGVGVALSSLGGGMIGGGVGAIVGEIIMLVETDGKKYEYAIENTYLDSKWPYPGRRYYVRPSHPGVYSKTSDETEIISAKQDINILSLKNSYYVWPKSGTYDLIMEIPAINFQDLANKNMLDTGDLFKGANIPWSTSVDFMKDSAGNSKPYRVIWEGIRVVDKRSESVDGTTIGWALNKIIALVNQNKTTKEQYKLDPAIYALTANMECPDLTISGGKYLYEVLEDLGREFNGLPRLLKDNTITFDILDSHTKAQKMHTFWKDANLLEIRKQDIEISSSGFVSQISNMIPDEDYTVYPGYDMFAYPRGEGNAAVVDVSSAAIVVDKPIYEIESVIVKDAIKIKGSGAISGTPLDITQYVYEETVYNALNANRAGKGMALVWKQGDKFIRGLGQLPEQSLLYAHLGWESDEYVINNIVDDAIAQAKRNETGWQEKYTHNTPDKMRFQVKYRGYINTTSFIENPDKKNDKYKMYTVMNQEANTISDKRFGTSALTQLKRHGTNIIEKSYIYTDLMFQPVLGAYTKVGTDVYYINDITYEFANDYIRADCKFSKNYSRINPKVNVKTEYRQYELQPDNNVDRMINFNQYCILGSRDINRENSSFVNWENVLKNAFNKSTSYRPDTFYFNCYYNNSEERLQYLSTKDTSSVSNDLVRKNVPGIALPCNYTRIGTSIQFSAQMADSFSAGQSVRRATKNQPKDLGLLQSWVRYVGDTWIPDSAKSNSNLNIKTVSITDQTPYMRVTIGTLPNSIKSSAEMTYPEVTWYSQPEVSIGTPYFSKKFPVYKDSRERLGFNYQMHFLSNKSDLFIRDGFTKYLLRSRDSGVKNVKPRLVAYNGNIGYTNTLNIYKSLRDVQIQTGLDYLDCSSNIIADKDYDGLAVIWPDTREILLELRKPIKAGEYLNYGNIYYNFSNKILR